MEGTEAEPINLVDVKNDLPYWKKHPRPNTNPGNRFPNGVSKQHVSRNPEVMHSMRQQGARLAVDMERGLYVAKSGRQAGKNWSGAYSRFEIAEALGYNSRHHQQLPKLFDEPHFSRYVEYERTVRDASYRMSMHDAMPMIEPIISGLMIESLRRVLINPEKIPDNVLFTEMRKFLKMKGEYEGAFAPPEDVKTLIVNFNMDADKLPEAARLKAREIFDREMRALIGPQDRFIDAVAEKK